jgi:hypothetical protein
MSSSQGPPFLAIYSENKHRMIYSFPNATSYSTFYTLFSSFRIKLWPVWLANSKRQPWFYPPQSHAQEDTQNWQKKCKTDGKPVLCQKIFSSGVLAVLYTVKLHSLTYSVWGPLDRTATRIGTLFICSISVRV